MKLLSGTTWTVDAIARMVGYQSSSNLYVAIKRLTGQTPVAWRATNRGPSRCTSPRQLFPRVYQKARNRLCFGGSWGRRLTDRSVHWT